MNRLKADRALDALRSFYETELDDALSRHLRADPQAFVLEFFRSVARDVPAYRKFIERAGVSAEAVRSLADFARIPPTTKENYHRAFALRELCRGGALDACDFVAVSSGSTGEPAVWPRFVSDEMATAWRFEQVLSDAMGAAGRRTLSVVCFALGSWVGGMYTTAACRHVAAKGYPITVVTPGNNKAEILRVVRALAPSFDQTVLFGYPPFLKDVIDSGVADGLDWSRHSIQLVTAGEVFSEEWRTIVCGRLGQANPHLSTASMYGTADAGVLACETPLSIRVRRFLADHPAAARELFGEARLPTLCQYDPLHRYFEVDGTSAAPPRRGPQKGNTSAAPPRRGPQVELGELLFSGDAGAPLVRYKILDRGGLIAFGDLTRFMADWGDDPIAELRADGRARVRELPFVFVFGRSNFALSFYGANIYPENVAIGLEQPAIARYVTGKFVIRIVRDRDEDPRLEVVAELTLGVAPGEQLAGDVARSIRTELERLNSEFLHYAPPDRRTPEVDLVPLGHPDYFPPGVKHRYTRE
jgi:phenylacetate-CoA ligase